MAGPAGSGGSKSQLSDPTDALTSHPIGEGFEQLITSGGFKLVFRSPAERYAYQNNVAVNGTQLGIRRGEHNKIQDNAAQS